MCLSEAVGAAWGQEVLGICIFSSPHDNPNAQPSRGNTGLDLTLPVGCQSRLWRPHPGTPPSGLRPTQDSTPQPPKQPGSEMLPELTSSP